ncbi:putative peptidyl-prolyl cis-trans isomerase [Corynebacterium pseudopelargi]|uniref:Putative peptidyl-prolyl cis-trans isomerase n=2 Tax=Corynebacterium pseudopelargi TaxID=2080757 RepID=A0A3G6IU49_9CORY|nr:putative peptidyl-prolyl cis-trans isomerase [Corynebacterium pseudopelargi]
MSNQQRRREAMEKLEHQVKRNERKQGRSTPMAIGAIAAVAVLLVGGYFGYQYFNEDEQEPQSNTLALSRETALGDTVNCEYPDAGEAAKKVDKPKTKDVAATGTVNITFDTTAGEIPLSLDRAVSPCTVNAIEHLAKSGFYDDTVCHRMVTEGLHILQCGDPTGQGTGGPGFSFANEYPTDEAEDQASPVVYPRGTVAMANSGPDTNGSQFFLNYGDSPLPPAYTYFGKIEQPGLDTLDAVVAEGVDGGGSEGAPKKEVKITSAKVQ